MEQYFTDYKNWEDWQNGMWNSSLKEQESDLIQDATRCLQSPKIAMLRVINEWPVSTRVNLTNVNSNRKSWLGQAACCIEYGVPESFTRSAWNSLSNEEKKSANLIAKEIIEEWERNYSN